MGLFGLFKMRSTNMAMGKSTQIILKIGGDLLDQLLLESKPFYCKAQIDLPTIRLLSRLLDFKGGPGVKKAIVWEEDAFLDPIFTQWKSKLFAQDSIPRKNKVTNFFFISISSVLNLKCKLRHQRCTSFLKMKTWAKPSLII